MNALRGLRDSGRRAALAAAILLMSLGHLRGGDPSPPPVAATAHTTPDPPRWPSPDDALDALGKALGISMFNGQVRVRASGLLDLEGYALTQPAPALIETQHTLLFNPRLSLFLDANIGPNLYGFLQARVDRGFDPADQRLQSRLDEYFLRYTLLNGALFSVAAQAGKFATVVGNWTPRHLSWDNAFINAPLPYENVTSAADLEAPYSATDFGSFRAYPSGKATWVPVIWGPSYASGLAVAGQVAGHFDFAFEIKNAALSSRPSTWDGTRRDWSHPTLSGRVGWRPGADWNFGVSASGGDYMTDASATTLPPGKSLDDYRQYTFGQDIAYAHGHWQVWAEAYESRFQVPNVGDADTFVYYLETKYQFTPAIWGGLRWNQQLFGEIPNGSGGDQVWGNDLWRTDFVIGCRLSEHFQFKLQYSYGREHDPWGESNVHVGAVQVTTKF